PHYPPHPLFPYTTLFRSVPTSLCASESRACYSTVRTRSPGSQRTQSAPTNAPCALRLIEILEIDASEDTTLYFAAMLQKIDQAVDRKSTRLNSSHEWISY